jgi:hypothetical protein
MSTQGCLDTVLSNTSFDEKERALRDFLKAAECEFFFWRPRTAHRWALRELEGATAPNHRAELYQVLQTLDTLRQRRVRQAADQAARALRALPPSTSVTIHVSGQEETVTLLKVQRTRFLATRSTGQTVSVPVQLFLRVAKQPAEEGAHAH